MTYLSFQHTLRRRLEKFDAISGRVENQTLELRVKFNVRTNEKSINDGGSAELGKSSDLDRNLVDPLILKLS